MKKTLKYTIFTLKSIYHYIDLITDISLVVLYFKSYEETQIPALK